MRKLTASFVATAAVVVPALAHAQQSATPNITSVSGRVRLAVTSVLVAPGKDSGLPWDGPGRLPLEVQRGLTGGLPGAQSLELFQMFSSGGGSLADVARVVPWAANTMISATAAPDVRVQVSIAGTLVHRTPTAGDMFQPTWGGAGYTPEVTIGPGVPIELLAEDVDAFVNDRIGVCTLLGALRVDEQGYATRDNFRCNGQLWSVALRVFPVTAAP